MRIPLARAGTREMLIITVLCGGPALAAVAAAGSGHAWCWPPAGLLLALWVGGLAFFRDPERKVPDEQGIMVSPADGVVVETADLDFHPDVNGPAQRIGIFLSVFNVHINRSPCSGTVRLMRYQPGQFVDARDPKSGEKNESNTIVIESDDPSEGPVVVRQIAGLIARRIVCNLKVGDRVTTGQRIGLIKFGSRTELIFPAGSRFRPAVKVGDQVRGAITIMARQQVAGRAVVGVGPASRCSQ
jgi:phosphatidylserine decarboxylase